ncbi:suppressor of fused domain protein [Aliikangiella sp. G2MR2-5]|uniref:suppressor of fused domain protein n=1 Tax=Aliikangiella sp. G2MR2-5 TaxID=2788943 RepID=UPI0018AADF90|nr:suppressor of fused domain protein [Aliikangiella sp. G2MR2-5]
MNENQLINWLNSRLANNPLLSVLALRNLVLAVDSETTQLILNVHDDAVDIATRSVDSKYDCLIKIFPESFSEKTVKYELSYTLNSSLPMSTARIIEQLINPQDLTTADLRENYFYSFLFADTAKEVIYENNAISLLRYRCAFKGYDVYITSGFSDESASSFAPYDTEAMGLSGCGKEFFFLSKGEDKITEVLLIFFKKFIDELYIFMRGRSVEWDYFETGFGGFLVYKNLDFGSSISLSSGKVYFDMFMPLLLEEVQTINHLKTNFEDNRAKIMNMVEQIVEKSEFGYRESEQVAQ